MFYAAYKYLLKLGFEARLCFQPTKQGGDGEERRRRGEGVSWGEFRSLMQGKENIEGSGDFIPAVLSLHGLGQRWAKFPRVL